MSFKYILDSSALLALLHSETGAEAVSGIRNLSVMSSVNACESVTRLILKGMPERAAQEALQGSEVKIIPFDAEAGLLAAFMIAKTKPFGLSLGDRACLATAQHLGLEAVTADQIWAKLDLPIKITLIR